MLEIGPARIEKIFDAPEMVLDAALLFPGRTLDDLAAHRKVLDPLHVGFADRTIHLALHSYVLRVGGLTILIDTCLGEHKHRPNRPDWNMRQQSGYLYRLAAIGLRPEDIDLVMCTHLHADHVGWNTRLDGDQWVPTFPKARYVVSRTELEHWQAMVDTNPAANHGSWRDSVAPVIAAGQVETMDDGASLAAGLDLLPLPGHTPGQTGLCLCHGDREARFVGDAIHSPLQVFAPDWASGFCSDPDQAVRTRKSLLSEAAANGALLFPAHIKGGMGAMRIHGTDAGFTPEFL